MEQNGHKFRIRLNLFDAIVLVVVLLAGAAFAWLSLRTGQGDNVTPNSQTIRYTRREPDSGSGEPVLCGCRSGGL